MSSTTKKIKVLIVTQFYYPDITACAFRIHETALGLVRLGCEVEIIAGHPHKETVINQQIDDGPIKVTRVKLFNPEKKDKLSYIMHYLSFMFLSLKAAPRHKGPHDIIWVTSPPLFAAISGWLLATLRKNIFCLDIRDIWPDSAVVAGQLSSDGMMYCAAKFLERFLYKKADLITTVAKPMGEYIQFEGAIKKPLVIYNATKAENVTDNPVKPNKKLDALEILYLGNMGYCQNLSIIIHAAELLKQKGYNKIRFVLTGGGVEKQALQSEALRLGLDNVKFNSVVSKDVAIKMIKDSDALILHLKDDQTMSKTIPSKVFDYMLAGRPILYGLEGEAQQILSDGNVFYDSSDPEDLAQKAIYLYDNYKDLVKSAANNINVLRSGFLRELMTEKLFRAFRQLCDK